MSEIVILGRVITKHTKHSGCRKKKTKLNKTTQT